MKPRRVLVRTSGLEGRRERLWAYGLTDLARLFGMGLVGVRKAVKDGRLDPSDLRSVIAFAARKTTKKPVPSPS